MAEVDCKWCGADIEIREIPDELVTCAQCGGLNDVTFEPNEEGGSFSSQRAGDDASGR